MAKFSFMYVVVIAFVFVAMYVLVRNTSTRKFDFQIDENEKHNHTLLPNGVGLTKAHALHFYELFLDILLNKHNRFEGHAENVQLLNYILRNDVKWRVTQTAMFNILDVTGNDYINKKEYEAFSDLFVRVGDQSLIQQFRTVIDRNIDSKIVKLEWYNFCNKLLRPKLIQDLQRWEKDSGLQLPNHQNITAQFTALDLADRNYKDLIHGQMDRAIDMMSEDFGMFVEHWEHHTPHTLDDPDMFVRRMGYWILNKFERWDSLYMWIFQMLDDNGDGNLTPQEVAHQFKIFEIPTIHVKEIFYYLDEEGNGIIERDEWADWSETFRKLLVLHFRELVPEMEDYE